MSRYKSKTENNNPIKPEGGIVRIGKGRKWILSFLNAG